MYIVYVNETPRAVFKGEPESMAFAQLFEEAEIRYMPQLTVELFDCIADQAEKHYFFIKGHSAQYDKGYKEGYQACKEDVLELLKNGGNDNETER